MPTATLSRGGTSVDISLIGQAGDLTVARDVGKPTLRKFEQTGQENPRTQDYQNATDSLTVTGMLVGSTAYSDAQTLAESLIKPRADSALSLDLSALPSKGTYSVAAPTASACTLTYVPGRLDIVGVQLTLAVVSTYHGGTQSAPGTTSPDSGGPGIKLDRSGTSITLDADLTVRRSVGRPGIKLNPNTGKLPIAIDQNDAAADTFEISGQLVSSTAESDATTLEEDIVRKRLGNDTLTLHFLGNTYGLDAYDVIPDGTQAVRTVFETGITGVVGVPRLNLQTVTNA